MAAAVVKEEEVVGVVAVAARHLTRRRRLLVLLGQRALALRRRRLAPVGTLEPLFLGPLAALGGGVELLLDETVALALRLGRLVEARHELDLLHLPVLLARARGEVADVRLGALRGAGELRLERLERLRC